MSNVSICNESLTFLGADRIMELEQDTEEARKCLAIFFQTRDEVQRGHPWNFCIARKSLATLDDEPVFEWGVAYQLPADCLRVLNTNIIDMPYKIEGRKLLCDQTGVKIKYIKRVEDPALFDANFSEALVAKLSSKLAYSIAESKTLADLAIKLYGGILADARSADAQEGTPDDYREGDWIDSRFENGGGGGTG